MLIASVVLYLVITVAIVNLAVGRRTFRPSMFGKVATAVYIVTVSMAMLYNYRGFHSPVVDFCVTVSAGMTLLSGVHYIWHASRLMSEPA